MFAEGQKANEATTNLLTSYATYLVKGGNDPLNANHELRDKLNIVLTGLINCYISMILAADEDGRESVNICIMGDSIFGNLTALSLKALTIALDNIGVLKSLNMIYNYLSIFSFFY